jgi:hypothetical protein
MEFERSVIHPAVSDCFLEIEKYGMRLTLLLRLSFKFLSYKYTKWAFTKIFKPERK